MHARKVYSTASFEQMIDFRLYEIRVLMMPLLAGIVLRTTGLTMFGMAVWRTGVLQRPGEHQGEFKFAVISTTLAALLTANSPLIWGRIHISASAAVTKVAGGCPRRFCRPRQK